MTRDSPPHLRPWTRGAVIQPIIVCRELWWFIKSYSLHLRKKYSKSCTRVTYAKNNAYRCFFWGLFNTLNLNQWVRFSEINWISVNTSPLKVVLDWYWVKFRWISKILTDSYLEWHQFLRIVSFICAFFVLLFNVKNPSRLIVIWFRRILWKINCSISSKT